MAEQQEEHDSGYLVKGLERSNLRGGERRGEERGRGKVERIAERSVELLPPGEFFIKESDALQ